MTSRRGVVPGDGDDRTGAGQGIGPDAAADVAVVLDLELERWSCRAAIAERGKDLLGTLDEFLA